MRVLLIQPTFTAILPEDYGRPAMYEPLGLGYLAAVARDRGHDVVVLDCIAEDWRHQQRECEYLRVGMKDADIADRMRHFNPDIIGVSCEFTGFDRDGRRIAALAKQTLPNAPVIVGGADATARAQSFAEEPFIDLVVRGEGEVVFLNLLERLEREGRLPDDLPGTSLPGRDNPAEDEITDVDSLPLPARDLLPMATYLEDQTPLMPYAKRQPIGFMVSSRGCPYNCIFCSTTKVWRKWRPRAPEKVVDEIEHLVRDYGVREIAFQDDSFLVDPERVRRICDEILRRNLEISWSVPPGLQANRFTPELLTVMKASGFYRACFPIESGDPEILDWIRKPVDFDEVLEAIDLCHRFGIWTYGNFIIGFPEQTAESIERTAQFAETCGLDMISVYIAQPYAGSELYDVFQNLGLMDPAKSAGSTVFNSLYDTKYFTAAELRAKRDELYGRFIRRRVKRLFTPKGAAEMWRKTNTPESFAYAMRIVRIMAANSLHARRINLFGSVAKKSDNVARERMDQA